MNVPWSRAALLAITLSGCAGVLSPRPPEPLRLLTDEELARYFVHEDEQLPERSSAPLGLAPKVAGRVPNWPLSGTRDISFSSPPGSTIGRIQADGSFDAALPADPPARLRPIDELLLDLNGFEPCSVTSLRAEPAAALGAQVDLFVELPVGRRAGEPRVAPLLSPPLTYAHVLPYQAGPGKAVRLWFVDRDVTVRGERKCLFRWVADPRDLTQYNLYANLELRRGWNVVSLAYRDGGKPSIRVVRQYLEAEPGALRSEP